LQDSIFECLSHDATFVDWDFEFDRQTIPGLQVLEALFAAVSVSVVLDVQLISTASYAAFGKESWLPEFDAEADWFFVDKVSFDNYELVIRSREDAITRFRLLPKEVP